MPLNPAQKLALVAIHERLGAARQALANLLGGVPEAADPAAKIDILQKCYGEISNYDRHYSTVRSALTTLVVGAGLVAAADPLKALACQQLSGNGQDPAFVLLVLVPLVLVPLVLEKLALTWLLFFLAVVVSLHFQRLTYACRKLEEEIERRIANAAGLATLGDEEVVGVKISGFRFRDDLSRVVKKVRVIYFDEMSILLLMAILIFFAMVVGYALGKCDTVFYDSHQAWVWAAIVGFSVAGLGFTAMVNWLRKVSRLLLLAVFIFLAIVAVRAFGKCDAMFDDFPQAWLWLAIVILGVVGLGFAMGVNRLPKLAGKKRR